MDVTAMRIAFLRCQRICQWHFERFITTASSITSTCSGNCRRRRRPNKWQDVGVFSTLMTIISMVWWKIAVGYAAVTQDRSQRSILLICRASRNNSARFNFIDLFIFIFTEMQCHNHCIYDREHTISVTVMEDWIRARISIQYIIWHLFQKRLAC